MYDLNWFKKDFADNLQKFSLEYLRFENGDFGDLDEVRCETDRLGLTISFWSSGYLGVHIYDYKNDQELMNLMTDDSNRSEIFNTIEGIVRNNGLLS